MTFSFSKIVNKILNESVDVNQVTDAIQNHKQILINYQGEDNDNTGRRLIEIFAYGLTKGNNPCIRAYQTMGDSMRGEPKWKLFRLDRILSWKDTGNVFTEPPKEDGWRDIDGKTAPDFNTNGDNTMSVVYQVAHFEPLTPEQKREILSKNKGINVNMFRGTGGRFDRYSNKLKNNVNKSINKNLSSDKNWPQQSTEISTGAIGKDKFGNDINSDNTSNPSDEPYVNTMSDNDIDYSSKEGQALKKSQEDDMWNKYNGNLYK
jgi:hypothetical protein